MFNKNKTYNKILTYRENNIHVMIISRVCVHTSLIHPNGEKVAKSPPPPYVEKIIFFRGGANAYFCPPPWGAKVGPRPLPGKSIKNSAI